MKFALYLFVIGLSVKLLQWLHRLLRRRLDRDPVYRRTFDPMAQVPPSGTGTPRARRGEPTTGGKE